MTRITSIEQVKQDANFANVVPITSRFFAADCLFTNGKYGQRSIYHLANGKVYGTQASLELRFLRLDASKATRYQLWRSGELLRSAWHPSEKAYRKYIKSLMHAIAIVGQSPRDYYA